jgi:hypothetical protein
VCVGFGDLFRDCIDSLVCRQFVFVCCVEMQLPTNVEASRQQLEQLKEHLMNIQDSCESLQVKESVSAIVQELTALEGAKVQVALAFTLASLVYVKMQLQGRDVSKHPIHEEIARIKSFVGKLNKLEKAASEEVTDAKQRHEGGDELPAKRVRPDSAAVKRIVTHHL